MKCLFRYIVVVKNVYREEYIVLPLVIYVAITVLESICVLLSYGSRDWLMMFTVSIGWLGPVTLRNAHEKKGDNPFEIPQTAIMNFSRLVCNGIWHGNSLELLFRCFYIHFFRFFSDMIDF